MGQKLQQLPLATVVKDRFQSSVPSASCYCFEAASDSGDDGDLDPLWRLQWLSTKRRCCSRCCGAFVPELAEHPGYTSSESAPAAGSATDAGSAGAASYVAFGGCCCHFECCSDSVLSCLHCCILWRPHFAYMIYWSRHLQFKLSLVLSRVWLTTGHAAAIVIEAHDSTAV